MVEERTALFEAINYYVLFLRKRGHRVRAHIDKAIGTYEAWIDESRRLIYRQEEIKKGIQKEILIALGPGNKESLEYIIEYYDRYPYLRQVSTLDKKDKETLKEKARQVKELCQRAWGNDY